MLPPWTPDLESLDLFLSVAEQGSLGKAAALHGITQPSASLRLAKLERRLGVPLLVRTTRGSTLTPNGEAVASWARDVITATRSLTDGVAALRSERTARLRIAASLTIAEYLLPTWLIRLRSTHPDAEVAVTVTNSHHVFADVRDGTVDIGLVESPTLPIDLGSTPIGYDRVALVVSHHHPLAHARPQWAPADLMDLPLLVREPGSGTQETFTRAIGTIVGHSVVAFPHAIELGSTATLLATARAGGGVAVVSARAAATDLANGTLVELPIKQINLRRRLNAVWLGTEPSELGAVLIHVAQDSRATTTAITQ